MKRGADKKRDDPDVERLPYNAHMPTFIAKKPWYMDLNGSKGLEHQKNSIKKQKIDGMGTWFNRGENVFETRQKSKKFRKGACKNCGSITHKARDCLERPRKVQNSAWKLNKTFGRDEKKIRKVHLGYEGSRDRWNGYDTSEQYNNIKDSSKEPFTIVKSKETEKEDEISNFSDDDSSSDEEEDTKPIENTVIGSIGAGKATIRNLRIREDTASYLKEFSTAEKQQKEADFVLASDRNDFKQAQVFAWDQTRDVNNANNTNLVGFTEKVANGSGMLHLNANPTEMMLLQRKAESKRGDVKRGKKQKLKSLYGPTLPYSNNFQKKDHITNPTNVSTHGSQSNLGKLSKQSRNESNILNMTLQQRFSKAS